MTKKIKVLMVDDEKRFRETTKKILMKKGFETILAESGEEALEKISEAPDVVILDIKMPGIDGHEALARIKKINPDLPVIMLTGHGGIPSAREALVEGAFDYLSKPCDIDLLAEKIKEACQLPGELSDKEERKVTSVMIPITEYTTINENKTIFEALNELKKSFITKMATNRLMETGHRSILVKGDDNEVNGILTIRDLLEMIMPAYLTAPKPSLADSIEYSPMFWKGMFSKGIIAIKDKCISDVMSPSPVSIESNSNLMEAAYLMIYKNERRLLVTLSGKTVGVIREQDLFFEMEKILNS
ncbi:response regulator [Desulfobacula toluolica]|uniref:Response regulator protein modulated with CBS domain pair n=1 Tax=Desulfobacula toluolica (strain DSM 7467 / Tol2) TaxID=651182 RepID=K0NJP3_DESTT|nr:response regulator [Desulfobacula toluolica]CCK80093.1 response regulator protein modulated with CBS domain pair [Desulfobacula toluolica Tol2]